MSLATFETTLTPETCLRRFVWLSGCALLAAGIAIIFNLPLSPILRLALLIAWIAEGFREVRRFYRGASRIQTLRLDVDGNITARGSRGQFEALTLLTGSVVLSRLAWLRVRFADGSEYSELLRGDPIEDLAWHRLQLIWRQRRAAFGRQEGS